MSETTGIGSLLKPAAKIYYSYLFSTSQSGRIMDLLSCEMGLSKEIDSKFRIILLLTLQECFRLSQEPITVECGIDDEHFALSVFFGMKGQVVDQAWSAAHFMEVKNHLHKSTFNWFEKSFRLELLLSLEVKDVNDTRGRHESSFHLREEADKKAAKTNYQELGDLEYSKLLTVKDSASQLKTPLTGQFISKSLSEADFVENVSISHGTQASKDDGSVRISSVSGDSVDSTATELIHRIQTGMGAKVVQKIHQGVQEGAVNRDENGKRWVEGVTKEIIAERNKLKELSEKLQLEYRQKTLEFKNKEQEYIRENSKKDVSIHQKDAYLVKVKEQFQRVAKQIEQLKSSTESTKEEYYKSQLKSLQDSLLVMKQDKDILQKRNDLLQSQITKSQAVSQSSQSKEHEEKILAVSRQLEESKKMTRQLMSKLVDAEKKKTSGLGADGMTPEQMKFKIANAEKAALDRKKETDLYRAKCDAMKMEVLKLQKEITVMKNAVGKKAAA